MIEFWMWDRVVNLVALIGLPVMFFLLRRLHLLRVNELEHLRREIDLLRGDVVRLEEKVDRHLLGHARSGDG